MPVMQKWRSHKIVEAASIYEFKDHHVVAVLMINDAGEIVQEDVEVPPEWTARGKPKLGDFLVRYEDGYISWSPKQVFLDGYKPVEMTTALQG